MFEDKKDALLAKAKEIIVAKGEKEELVAASKEILGVGDESTDEEKQEAANAIGTPRQDAYIEVENEKVAVPSAAVLAVISEADLPAHYSSNATQVEKVNKATADLLAKLTDSGLTCEEVAKVLDVTVAKVTRLAEEVKKSMRIGQDKAFKVSFGKYAPELTLKELAGLTAKKEA